MSAAFVSQLDWNCPFANRSAVINSATTTGGAGPNNSLVLVEGNLLIAISGNDNAMSHDTWEDSLGNDWNYQGPSPGNQLGMWTTLVTKPGTATFECAGTADKYQMWVGQYSGIASATPLWYSPIFYNGNSTAANGMASPASPGNETPAGALIVGFYYGSSGSGATSFSAGTSPNAFTSRGSVWAVGFGTAQALAEDFIVPSAGDYYATATNTDEMQSYLLAAAFGISGGGGGGGSVPSGLTLLGCG